MSPGVEWRRIALENWRYKIAAFILATLLWMTVTANERDDQRVPTRLEFDVRDTSWVLVDPPTEVQTTFEGRTRDLLALRISGPVLRVGVDSVTGETMRVPLSSGQVTYDADLGVRPTAIAPGSVELRFEARRRRRVPVRPELEAAAAAGRAVVRPFLVQPDSVTVSGAAAAMERVTHVVTRPVALEGLEHTVTREVPVQLPAGGGGVTVTPASVLVTVEVDSLVERILVLPVRPRGAGAAAVEVEADSVRVTLRGAWRIVRDAAAAAGSAFVEVETAPESPVSLPVSVDLPEASPISATIRPGRVPVRPLAAPAPGAGAVGGADGAGGE